MAAAALAAAGSAASLFLTIAAVLVLAPVPAAAQVADLEWAGETVDARTFATEFTRTYVRTVMEARRREFEDAGRGRVDPAKAVADFERPEVIAQLDRAGQADPADDWIVGHRVGMRVKQGRIEEAAQVAQGCEASEWWCAALEGFTLHLVGRYAEAEAAFDRSLETMPAQQWCAWTEEIVQLLEGEAAEAYAAARCADREPLARRMWWLANPLFLVEGNERKTEHFARLVALQLHDETLELANQECAPEHRRAFLVLGVPAEWWSFEQLFIPFDEAAGYRWVPAPGVLADPFASGPSDWGTRPARRQERRDPAYGPMFAPLSQQVAFFVRGDSLLVLAAADLSRHPVAVRGPVEAGLALSASEDEEPVIVRERLGGEEQSRMRLQARAPIAPHLVSVEALAEREGAARARFGHRLPEPTPGGVGLSDVLLFTWAEGMEPGADGASLDEVMPLMLGATAVPREAPLGVYWELYGVRDGQTVQVTVAGVPAEPGLLRRLGQAVRLLSPRETMEISWTETAERDGAIARALRLDLSELSEAEYTLEFRVSDGTGAPVAVRRVIEIEGG